jgi:biotin carboxyl carrier protein
VTADDPLRRADGGPRPPRTDDERIADHAAIERLADDLVPALIAKLSASALGEIEIGEDDWTVRVRRPSDGSGPQARRHTERASRSQPGHAGHGHGPAAFEGHRAARDPRPVAGGAPISSNGANAGEPSGDGSASGSRPSDGGDPHRVVATSPAVGVFQPRSELTAGTRVRGGDRLGAVDMLGIPQEVVAPADGILGASLVEAGQAVEYGQELIVIELAGRATERADG